MVKTIGLVSLLLFCSSVRADNIYLRHGFALVNCHVKDTVDGYIRVETTDRQRRFALDVVVSIIKKTFDQDHVTKYYIDDREVMPQDYPFAGENDAGALVPLVPDLRGRLTPTLRYRETLTRIYLVPVGIAFAALGIDYLSDAGDLQDQIEALNKLGKQSKLDFSSQTGSLESMRSRKSAIGYICIGVGIISFMYGIIPEQVEIKPTGSGLSMRYSF